MRAPATHALNAGSLWRSLLMRAAWGMSCSKCSPHPASAAAQEERQEPDAEFRPNLINTICFLVNFAIQVGHAASPARASPRPHLPPPPSGSAT
jgi:hypothetical protein